MWLCYSLGRWNSSLPPVLQVDERIAQLCRRLLFLFDNLGLPAAPYPTACVVVIALLLNGMAGADGARGRSAGAGGGRVLIPPSAAAPSAAISSPAVPTAAAAAAATRAVPAAPAAATAATRAAAAAGAAAAVARRLPVVQQVTVLCQLLQCLDAFDALRHGGAAQRLPDRQTLEPAATAAAAQLYIPAVAVAPAAAPAPAAATAAFSRRLAAATEEAPVSGLPFPRLDARRELHHLAAGSLRTSTRTEIEHDLPPRFMLTQTRELGQSMQRRSSACSQYQYPPCLVQERAVLDAEVRVDAALDRQGLTLVHFSAQRKHILWDTLAA